MKVVYLLSTESDVARALPLMRGNLSARVIALEWEGEQALRRAGIDYRVADTYLTDARYREATEQGYWLARRWYEEPDLKEQMLYKGVPLAMLFEHMLYYYFTSIFYSIEVLQAVITEERPDRLVAFRKPPFVLTDPVNGLLIQEEEYPDEEVLPWVARQAGVMVDFHDGQTAKALRRGAASRSIRLTVGPWRLSVPVPGQLASRLGSMWVTLQQRLRARSLESGRRQPWVYFTSTDLSVHRIYRPVVEELKRRGTHRIGILSQSATITRAALEPGLCFTSVDAVLGRRTRKRIRDETRRMWEHFRTLDEVHTRLQYQGVPIWPIAAARFEFLFTRCYFEAAKGLEAVERLAGDGRLHLLVTGNEARDFNRSCIVGAARVGVPSLVLSHGVSGSRQPHYLGFEPCFATAKAMWGQGCVDIHLEYGCGVDPERRIDPRKLVVTGAPNFDRYLLLPPDGHRERTLRDLGLDPSKKIALYAADRFNKGVKAYDIYFSYEERTAHLRGLLNAMGELPDVQLVIKASPGDWNVRCLQDLIEEAHADNVIVSQFGDLLVLLRACDAVIVHHSTIGLEGLLLGKPLIVMNFTPRPDRMDFVQAGVAVGVYRPEDLAPVIRKIFSDLRLSERLAERRDDYLHRYLFKLDGASSVRVADLIEAMAGDAFRAMSPERG
ncbi:MAG: hypothetical protein HY726_04510 [Candidatus Rokubacteria bacterium]|nr:hypothetical protein [Candidatus Rokubacteria bacterium]